MGGQTHSLPLPDAGPAKRLAISGPVPDGPPR